MLLCSTAYTHRSLQSYQSTEKIFCIILYNHHNYNAAL